MKLQIFRLKHLLLIALSLVLTYPLHVRAAIEKLADEEDTKAEQADSRTESEKVKDIEDKELAEKVSGLLSDLPDIGDPVETVAERLQKVLNPYKLTSKTSEFIFNPDLSDSDILSWRMVFSKPYNKPSSDTELMEDQETESENEAGEIVTELKKAPVSNATVTLIPTGALDLEKALLLRRESIPTDKVLRELIFMKYGITWSKFPCQYERITTYLGTDKYFHYFASADISVIYILFRAMDMKDGADLTQLMIDNLMIEDENLFTKRFCITQLAKFNDPAIPQLVKAIKRMVTAEEYPIAQFLALAMMHTPQSFMIVNEAATSKNSYLRKAAFSAVQQLENGAVELLPTYDCMISSREAITFGSNAFLSMEIAENIEPLIDEILAQPHSVQEFQEATAIKWQIKSPGLKTPHKTAFSDITLSLIRSGEIANSGQFIDVNESKEAREQRLHKLDEERIADSKKRIIQAKQVDISVLTALEMAFFYSADKRVSRDYITRLNNVGISILKELPAKETKDILNRLIKYNTSKEETAKLIDIRAKAGF